MTCALKDIITHVRAGTSPDAIATSSCGLQTILKDLRESTALPLPPTPIQPTPTPVPATSWCTLLWSKDLAPGADWIGKGVFVDTDPTHVIPYYAYDTFNKVFVAFSKQVGHNNYDEVCLYDMDGVYITKVDVNKIVDPYNRSITNDFTINDRYIYKYNYLNENENYIGNIYAFSLFTGLYGFLTNVYSGIGNEIYAFGLASTNENVCMICQKGVSGSDASAIRIKVYTDLLVHVYDIDPIDWYYNRPLYGNMKVCLYDSNLYVMYSETPTGIPINIGMINIEDKTYSKIWSHPDTSDRIWYDLCIGPNENTILYGIIPGILSSGYHPIRLDLTDASINESNLDIFTGHQSGIAIGNSGAYMYTLTPPSTLNCYNTSFIPPLVGDWRHPIIWPSAKGEETPSQLACDEFNAINTFRM